MFFITHMTVSVCFTFFLYIYIKFRVDSNVLNSNAVLASRGQTFSANICNKICSSDSRVLGAADSHTWLLSVAKRNQLFWARRCSIKALKLCFFFKAMHTFAFTSEIVFPLHGTVPPLLLRAGNEHRRFCASLWRGLGPPTLPNNSTWC